MKIATEHPYVTRVRRAKENFDRNRDDPAPLFDLHAEDVVLHAPGTSPLGGGVRGRANVFARMQQMAELSGGTFAAVSTSLSGNGDFVARSRNWKGSESRQRSKTAHNPGALTSSPRHYMRARVPRGPSAINGSMFPLPECLTADRRRIGVDR